MSNETEDTSNPLIGILMASTTVTALSILAILAIKFVPGCGGNSPFLINAFSISFTLTLSFSVLALLYGFKFFVTCLKYSFTAIFVVLIIILIIFVLFAVGSSISSGLTELLV